MKIKNIAIATMLAAGMSSGIAFADGITAESGVYVTGQLGWSFPDAPNLTSSDFSGQPSYSYSQTSQNFVGGATVGYDYAFTQNWMAGLELGYLYMGQNKYSATVGGVSANETLQNWGVQLMATGTYVMPSGWNVFGKVGGVYQTTKASGSGSIPSVGVVSANESFSDVIPALAVGVGYLFAQNLSMALQYEHTFGDDWNSNNLGSNPTTMTQNIVTLGLTYKFPM